MGMPSALGARLTEAFRPADGRGRVSPRTNTTICLPTDLDHPVELRIDRFVDRWNPHAAGSQLSTSRTSSLSTSGVIRAKWSYWVQSSRSLPKPRARAARRALLK